MLTCGKTRSSFLAGKSKGRQLFFYMRLPATDLDFVGFGVLGFLQWGSIGGFGLEKGSTGSTIANDDNDRSRNCIFDLGMEMMVHGGRRWLEWYVWNKRNNKIEKRKTQTPSLENASDSEAW
ncbi:uncharacterized protein LOC114395661 [Glycine soja]|uniref:Uncharacterized protein n=1 Tax=Glycine soja TaxID=3848 RepID=A0A445FT42_GLYSO|nr:uncharacterized protein LOC114395661 [Glycine soja]RZB52014.1 hypothetical protein D0Y65_048439 [Glycine soja]